MTPSPKNANDDNSANDMKGLNESHSKMRNMQILLPETKERKVNLSSLVSCTGWPKNLRLIPFDTQ